MWNSGNGNDQTGQVAARMETTPSLGSASISISQQQAPKKFAPVVAPKPKFNPYKQVGEPTHSDPAGKNTGESTHRDYEATWDEAFMLSLYSLIQMFSSPSDAVKCTGSEGSRKLIFINLSLSLKVYKQ